MLNLNILESIHFHFFNKSLKLPKFNPLNTAMACDVRLKIENTHIIGVIICNYHHTLYFLTQREFLIFMRKILLYIIRKNKIQKTYFFFFFLQQWLFCRVKKKYMKINECINRVDINKSGNYQLMI